MNQTYVVKGSNTLYHVWGIITFVFAGIYGIGALIATVVIGMASSLTQGWIGELTGENLGGIQIVLVLIFLLVAVLGLTIRILAGLYLVRLQIRSKGALIFISVIYFLFAFGNLIQMVMLGFSGGSSMIFAIFIQFFCMCWSIATGVFLILKQAQAVPEGTVVLNGAVRKKETRYRPVESGKSPVRSGSSKAEIEGLFGNYKGKTFVFRGDESCRIGRDSGCDIQISHPKVSRIHCAVRALPDGKFEITDYSYNGTFYENIALPNGKAVVVQAGGMLVLGSADNVFLLKALL